MRTDRHDEAKSRSWQFCERVYKVMNHSGLPKTAVLEIATLDMRDG